MDALTLLIAAGVVGCFMLLEILVQLAKGWRDYMRRKRKGHDDNGIR